MMNPILTKDVGNKKINIYQDIEPTNPRDYDMLGTILYTSSRYVLGDKQTTTEEIEEILADKNNLALPVFAYIHSGIMLSTSGFSCPWDSGQCGIIYVSHEKIKEEYGKVNKSTLGKAKACLDAEVKEFSNYLDGNVYGFTITDENGHEIDSCWGFYESPDELIKTVEKEFL